MKYQKFLSDSGAAANSGIKIIKNYQEMLSLLQAAIYTGEKIADILKKISAFVFQMDPSETDGSRKEMLSQWLIQINQLAERSTFRNYPILNGKSGITGETSDPRIQIIRCGDSEIIEKEKLLPVKVNKMATHALCRSVVSLTNPVIKKETYLYINYKNKYYEFDVRDLTSVPQFMAHLKQFILYSGLNLGVGINQQGELMVYFHQPGKANRFSVLSANTKMFSDKGNCVQSTDGEDIEATVNNVRAVGVGNFAVAYKQQKNSDGLIINIRGMLNQPGETVGYVKLCDQSWAYKNEAGQLYKIVLPSLKTNDLGKGLVNESGFNTLSDIQPNTAQQCADSLNMAQWAIQDVRHMINDFKKLEKLTKELCLDELRGTLEQLQPNGDRIKDVYSAGKIAESISRNFGQISRSEVFA